MLRAVLTALALAAVPAAAAAQSVAYDGFNYPAQSNLNGLNGGSGWGTAWNTTSTLFSVSAGSVSNPGNTLATTGNRLEMPAATAFTSAGCAFSTNLAAVNNGSVWVSFAITRTLATTDSGYGGIVIGNDPGSSATTGRLFIGDTGVADIWAVERAGGGGVGALSNFTLAQTPTALLVVNIQFNPTGADTVALYVNRPPGGPTPGSVDAFLGALDINPGNAAVTDLGVWYGNGSGYQLDEIRVGTSFADVTPVPEPGPVLAVAAAGMGLLTASRRRRPAPGRP